MGNFFDRPQRRQNAQHEREERKLRDFTLLADSFAATYKPVSVWCEGITFFTMTDLRKMFSVWASSVSDPIDDLLDELTSRGFSIQHDVQNRMGIPTIRNNNALIPPAIDPADDNPMLEIRDNEGDVVQNYSQRCKDW